MDCPFERQRETGTMVCDYGGMRPEPGISQCPTEFFNKCQGGEPSKPMGYRRLFIMRKDLKMSSGKLAAQVAHCAEAYWTNFIRIHSDFIDCTDDYLCSARIQGGIFESYINDSFVKTICEARNKNQLLKAKTMAEELGLVEGVDFGLIYDSCLTELIPEEDNGTTLTGIWFAPLPDETAHSISKKYHLYV